MKIEITNGCTVHRINASGLAELLAAFQYDADARDFAALQLANDAARGWRDSMYAVSDSNGGKLTVHQHPEAAK